MHYEIKPVTVDGFDAPANGVWKNKDGAWLGEVAGDQVMPYTCDGEPIAAPDNWRGLVLRNLRTSTVKT